MKSKSAFAILLAFCFAWSCRAACPERIEAFYKAYMRNLLQDTASNAALCASYLTEGLIARVGRIASATGADPIVRAQDMNEDAISTLSVESLGGNWYLVKYCWRKGDASSAVEIPLKTQQIDGVCRICYITPVWHGSRYGDELTACASETGAGIDRTSAESFLKSFYDVYLAVYCAMPEDLEARLAALRAECLSQQAAVQFAEAVGENLRDGLYGYDALIGQFDFDCLWRSSLEIKHVSDSRYRVAYCSGNETHEIVLTVGKSADEYLIERIDPRVRRRFENEMDRKGPVVRAAADSKNEK